MYRTVKSTRCNSTPGSASLQTLAVTASPDAAQRKKCVHVRKQQQPTLFKLLVVVVVVVWWHWLFCCALLVYWPSGLYYASERICACSNCQTSPHDCSALQYYYYVAHQQNIRENAFPKVCPEKSAICTSVHTGLAHKQMIVLSARLQCARYFQVRSKKTVGGPCCRSSGELENFL